MANNDNTFFRRVFDVPSGVSPKKQFGLTRKTRYAHLFGMLHIMQRHHLRRGVTPKELRSMLEELGPSFIKIGQTLSTRSEILPPAYCEELSHLQMECEPLPFDLVLTALDTIYGEKREQIFSDIDPTPLGSASLAQVHRATLRATGETVAIKVQRPGVRTTMAQDIDMMRSLAKYAQRFMKDNQIVDLRDVVEELWQTFLEETDFKKEAENLVEFGTLNNDVAFIRCPKPYLEYCTEEVLVMEYIDGISIRDTNRLLDAGYDLSEIGEKLLDNYATQILDFGFFHADPHPGNIVIKDGQIVYLDLGIMGRLTNDERANFGRVISAVGHKNAAMLEDALICFSVGGDISSIDHPKLLDTLDRIISRYASADVADIDIGAFLTDITAAMRECKVELPSCLTAVARGLVTLEGTLLRFVGSFNMVDIINNHMRNAKNDADEFKQAAQDLIIEFDRTARGMARAAEHIGDATRMLSRGQLKFNMEMLGSDEPMGKISRIVNRLTLGMIIAGSFVSASLVSTMAGPSFFGLPVLSFVGYAVGTVLTIWVLVDIIRRGNNP